MGIITLALWRTRKASEWDPAAVTTGTRDNRPPGLSSRAPARDLLFPRSLELASRVTVFFNFSPRIFTPSGVPALQACV
jgi:hypothetical protein